MKKKKRIIFRAALENTRMFDKLENVTQTISRILDGYDIRLRPNFGGRYNISPEIKARTTFFSRLERFSLL